MSQNYTQDRKHSASLLKSILEGEKAQHGGQQQSSMIHHPRQQYCLTIPYLETSPSTSKPADDSVSILSTSTIGSTKALLKDKFTRSDAAKKDDRTDDKADNK
ncbi:Uu.00g023760.m01.CDS01 [Anthostomella pinea]|uniref:Uu.00g023760.m01.CDS01 n=1 Tax=Anthostomella pinea TaxID=933095 RepID=A0AAI8W067_9PEZI|nr:Uu.00g023760.m01.CDS01 [Anthostomella pinea]